MYKCYLHQCKYTSKNFKSVIQILKYAHYIQELIHHFKSIYNRYLNGSKASNTKYTSQTLHYDL